MTFEEWHREMSVVDDEYYSKADMRWFAELAWDAAIVSVPLDVIKQKRKDCLNGKELKV